jgi:glycosidase
VAAPSWVQHAIWWQLYPLGFAGAERSAPAPGAVPGDGLRRLLPWLDYAVELGASGIALGPVFAAETHGYDTTDYYRIDPRLGDGGDFDRLVAAAHARGLRVLLDGVFNHVGRSFAPFRDAVRGGPAAATAPWFCLDWSGRAPGAEPGYADFEGHHRLVALNHAEPAVATFVAGVMKHWLGRGADGWRLDAAYAVPPSFWTRVLGEVRREFPEAYFVGEYIHGDYAAAVAEGSLDSATQYELWKAIWSSLNDANYFELAAALERHNAMLESFAPLTFVGNHDVTRIASRLTDPALLPLALVVLFTVGGTPSVYYGDEQAFRGTKEDRVGGDDDVRPAFPSDPAGLPGAGGPVFGLHRQLIGLRRRHPWLHSARSTVHFLANGSLSYSVVGADPVRERLVVALNLAAGPADVEVPADAAAVVAGSGTLSPGRIRLGGRGWAILADGT